MQIMNSAIGNKHLAEAHEQLDNPKEGQVRLLRKCQTKFECLILKMLLITKDQAKLELTFLTLFLLGL